MALLITKTHFSTPSPNLVDRTRLLNNLDSLLMPGRQVALVSAPAGFGKTTMLTQWLQTVPDPFFVCWLSLDMSDNHLIRFFSYVVAVLQKADPKIGDNFSALVETHPELTADEIVTYIINQVASSSQNILLVIDDTHVISTMEIHRAIEMLVNYMPSNLRLVLAGRIDPVLPLARLRARGQLVEVRTADLRFNVEETSVFLDQFAGLSSMAASLKNALNLSIEGWVAGLQMMVIALRAELRAHGGQPAEVLDLLVSELSGSHRYILDYLLDEVLNRAEPGVREFLLQTCILERFNADLCAAICTEQTSAAEAQSMLANLERANLFIVPLDNQREWYRYHHLFADVLQKQLLHAHPGLAPSLHRRAVDWFEKHGMLDEAIAHAHHSGDAALLFSLVENYALETILRGQITTAIRWLDSLSKEMLMSSTRLCLDCAWALTFTSQTEAAVPYLERATALLQERPNQAMLIRSEILGLQSYRENTYGRANEAVRLARLALENSPEDQPFLQCSNHLFLAGGLARLGQLEEALAEYNIIQSLYQNRENLAGLALLEADFLHYIAMHLNARGAMGQAKTILRQAIQSFTINAGGRLRAAALFLYVALGKILFLENDLEGAEKALQQAMQLDSISMSVAAFDGWETLWWIKIGKADFPEARKILSHLEQATHDCDEKVIRTVVWTSALQDLLEGKVDHAAARLAKLGLNGKVGPLLSGVTDSELMSWRCNEFFTLARVLAAQQRTEDSLEVLARMERAATTIHIDWVRYRVWITQAIVYDQVGHSSQAMEILTRLLDCTLLMEANPARIYLAAGERARTLLLKARQHGIQQEHVTSLLAGFPPQVQSAMLPDSPEALTEREMEVLRLMADGLKNQEIADRLVVSLNTVRYHSKNIFGKLGVVNRTAAVSRARELGFFN